MEKHKNIFTVEKMANTLNVSVSGYYKHINKKESPREKENKELVVAIKEVYKRNRKVYGSPRIHAILKKQGKQCSRRRIARIMQKHGIKAKTKRKWKVTTKATKDMSRIAPNLINQNFTVQKKDSVWVSDITYIETSEGWLYVAATLDLFSRRVIGLSMDKRMSTDLVLKSLNQAVYHRNPQQGIIAHSDRGSQYTSTEYKKHAAKHGIRLSMSSTGNCFDNAAMESFFHTLKTEHVFFQNFRTREEASQSIFEYVEVFYNRQRVHSTLGYLSPCDFEKKSKRLFANSTEGVKFPIFCV